MEVAAVIGAHDFELAIDGFHSVGGAEGAADGFRVMQEGQVVGALFLQLGDESRRGGGKTLAEVLELLLGELRSPGSFNGTPALLKLNVLRFGEIWGDEIWRCVAWARCRAGYRSGGTGSE